MRAEPARPNTRPNIVANVSNDHTGGVVSTLAQLFVSVHVTDG